MRRKLRLGLIAHDNKKRDLLEWVYFNRDALTRHRLIATGTTGTVVEEMLGVDVEKVRSGPLGGDQEIGAMLVNDKIDALFFFWDGLDAHPHDPDVKALLRLSVVWNVPTACNRSTADMIISSPLFEGKYERTPPDLSEYSRNRPLDISFEADDD